MEETIAGRTVINVELSPDLFAMEELVVIGYGTQRKSVVTGAISSVRAVDLENQPIQRVEQAIQGRTSGVIVAANAGQPGSSSTVRVRGLTTFDAYGGNNPLWVIDGVMVHHAGIGFINQSDIESIEVLKDAASLAIYGARAASGVILVTTKRGRPGEISVNYNVFAGISAPARKLQLLNATEYGALMNERAVADGRPVMFANPMTLGEGTDWQSVIFNNRANRMSHELSITGGPRFPTFSFHSALLTRKE